MCKYRRVYIQNITYAYVYTYVRTYMQYYTDTVCCRFYTHLHTHYAYCMKICTYTYVCKMDTVSNNIRTYMNTPLTHKEARQHPIPLEQVCALTMAGLGLTGGGLRRMSTLHCSGDGGWSTVEDRSITHERTHTHTHTYTYVYTYVYTHTNMHTIHTLLSD